MYRIERLQNEIEILFSILSNTSLDQRSLLKKLIAKHQKEIQFIKEALKGDKNHESNIL